MKRTTKRKVSTVIGCVIGGLTYTGPLAGQYVADYQCNRGLCDHPWHTHRYQQHMTAKAIRKALR